MLSSWQHSQQGSTGNHFNEGMTSVKKQSCINSRNISFSISNSKTQNSPYQVKTKHRTNDKARQPLLGRDCWSNTKWVQTITQRMSLQVRCVTRHTWITQNRNVLHQTMTPLLCGMNLHLSSSESCTHLAQRTQLMCWFNENRNFCLWTVHTLIVLSSEAVTKDWPSLEKWTLLTVPVWALNTVDSPLLHKREELFKTAQQGSTDIAYLKTQSWVLSSASSHPFMGTACDHIRIKTLISPKCAHASWATQLKPVAPVPYWRPNQHETIHVSNKGEKNVARSFAARVKQATTSHLLL